MPGVGPWGGSKPRIGADGSFWVLDLEEEEKEEDEEEEQEEGEERQGE